MGRIRRAEYEVFALNIKTIYKAWKLTEGKFGALLGVSRSTVSNWTTAYSIPAFHEMRLIERLTGLTQNDLMSNLIERAGFPKQPYETLEISPKPRLLSEPLVAYGDGPEKRPLVETPGLEARLERIERLLLQVLERLANIEKRSAE